MAKYYLRRPTDEEAVGAINELVEFYKENADMTLDFNKAGFLVKLLVIRCQYGSPSVDKAIDEALRWVNRYMGS